jgi:hypothetical protein
MSTIFEFFLDVLESSDALLVEKLPAMQRKIL